MGTSPSNTNVGILAAGIYPSLAALRAAAPPLVQRFARVLGLPKLLRFNPLDTSTDDAWNAIVPALGGGAWLDAPTNDRGVDLTAANGFATSGTWSVGVQHGPWNVVPVSTLTGNITAATLAVVNQDGNPIKAGESKFISRLDVTGNSIAWVNAGPAGGTLCTMPASQAAWAWFWFNGTDWLKRASAVML
jgi:hypothetical protein